MRARTFMQVSIGILALAAAFALGANRVKAQTGTAQIVSAANIGGTNAFLAMTGSGDTYFTTDNGQSWLKHTNCFTGLPTPAQPASFGQLKARYC